MTKFLFIFILLPFIVFGQNIYSGQYGKYKHQWTFKINQDSSVVFIRNIDTHGYEEYRGHIRKISDTIFSVRANLSFSQIGCRAIGDSVIYIGIDSVLIKTIDNIKIEYSNSEVIEYSTKAKNNIKIPINKKLYTSDTNKNFFYVNLGHINPINNNVVKTKYKIGDEYCVEIYTENDINFNVVIKNDKLRKIGKGQIQNFILTKNSSK